MVLMLFQAKHLTTYVLVDSSLGNYNQELARNSVSIAKVQNSWVKFAVPSAQSHLVIMIFCVSMSCADQDAFLAVGYNVTTI
jgi:hypothetical protein